jgi:hypothetical protein
MELTQEEKRKRRKKKKKIEKGGKWSCRQERKEKGNDKAMSQLRRQG